MRCYECGSKFGDWNAEFSRTTHNDGWSGWNNILRWHVHEWELALENSEQIYSNVITSDVAKQQCWSVDASFLWFNCAHSIRCSKSLRGTEIFGVRINEKRNGRRLGRITSNLNHMLFLKSGNTWSLYQWS